MDFKGRDPGMRCQQEALFKHENTEKRQTQARGEEAGAAAFPSDQRHLKTKNATRNKRGTFQNNQEDPFLPKLNCNKCVRAY